MSGELREGTTAYRAGSGGPARVAREIWDVPEMCASIYCTAYYVEYGYAIFLADDVHIFERPHAPRAPHSRLRTRRDVSAPAWGLRGFAIVSARRRTLHDHATKLGDSLTLF